MRGQGIVRAMARDAIQITSGYWDINEAPVMDLTNAQYEFIETREEGGSYAPTVNLLRFQSQDQGKWMVPSASYIELAGHFVRADTGANFAAGSRVAIAGDIMSIFSRAEYYIGERSVENIEFPGIASMVMNIVDAQAPNKQGSQWLAYPDLPGNLVGTGDNRLVDPATGLIDETHNHGFYERQRVANTSSVFYTRIPLTHIFKLHEFCPRAYRGIKHRLELTRQQNAASYVLRTTDGDNVDAVYVIDRLVWWMPLAVPTNSMQAKLEGIFSSGEPMVFGWQGMNVFRHTSNVTTDTWQITTTSTLPLYTFVLLQLQSVDSSQLENSGVPNTSLTVNSIHMRYNGEDFPRTEIRTDNGANYIRAYQYLLQYMRRDNVENDSSIISFKDFVNTYRIWTFDFTKVDQLQMGAASAAILEVVYELAAAPAAYNVYAVVVSDRYMKIEGLSSNTSMVTEVIGM